MLHGHHLYVTQMLLIYQNGPLRIHKADSKETTVVADTKIIIDCILTTHRTMCWDLCTDTLGKKELTKGSLSSSIEKWLATAVKQISFMLLTHSLEEHVKRMHFYSSSLSADSAIFDAAFPHPPLQFLFWMVLWNKWKTFIDLPVGLCVTVMKVKRP